jgi:UDPglucose--hexose-1-phosphate uridylyltransferase
MKDLHAAPGSPDPVAEALCDRSHRRRNALTDEWVLVSPHRTLRPWLGEQQTSAAPASAPYDPRCYLCPGNVRANGVHNPAYEGVYVFANDFPALSPAVDPVVRAGDLFGAEGVSGECRVICYSPRHDLSLGELSINETTAVVRGWRAQFRQLSARDDVSYVLIFENRGEMMGASNPHPHGQIWATSSTPNEIGKELRAQRAYRQRHGRALLADYVEAETRIGSRIVTSNEHWTALVPFWAVWPFELLLLPQRRLRDFEDLGAEEETSLAKLLHSVIAAYDRLFETPFPYSMGWHPRPSDGETHAEWILHAHFYPPLLRSASIRKFQVGFEMFAMPQRDLTPEAAAAALKDAVNRVR